MKPALAVLGAALAASLIYGWLLFIGGFFAYHDLTPIAEFLANTARGEWFWVSDFGLNHLRIHFTPSLALVAPLFGLFDSQFVLVAANVTAMFAGALCLLYAFRELLSRAGGGADHPRLLLLFSVLVCCNVFLKENLFSAHFEVFGFTLNAALLLLLVRERPLYLTMPLTLLAAGIRQDAGFFLAFQLAALLLLPRSVWKPKPSTLRGIAILAGASLAWFALCLTVFMPLVGARPDAQAAKFWAAYGATWKDVFFYFLARPWELAGNVLVSGLPFLALSLFGLPLAAPLAFLTANAPAALLYIAQVRDKKFLLYYNSAFILATIMLCAGAGLIVLYKKFVENRRVARRLPALTALAAAALVAVWAAGPGTSTWKFFKLDFSAAARYERVLAKALDGLPPRAAVAADFRNLVYVPNSRPKYQLGNYAKAEVVIISPGMDAFASGFANGAEALARLRSDPRFAEALNVEGWSVFRRRAH